MKIKKVCLVFLIFTIILPIKCFSYNYLESDKNDNLLSTSSSLNETPTINARHSVILDRSSKTVLYGKCENEKCKMASTTNIMTT